MVYRASIGDLQKPLALSVIQFPVDSNTPIDAIDSPCIGFASSAIAGVNLSMRRSTFKCSRGSCLCRAYMRSVMEVQAPSDATNQTIEAGLSRRWLVLGRLHLRSSAALVPAPQGARPRLVPAQQGNSRGTGRPILRVVAGQVPSPSSGILGAIHGLSNLPGGGVIL